MGNNSYPSGGATPRSRARVRNNPCLFRDAILVERGKKKSLVLLRGFRIKNRQRLTLPGVILVPSALAGLTALFGMGRGDPRRYSHLKVLAVSRWRLANGKCSLQLLMI